MHPGGMASDPETAPNNVPADWAASISGSNAGDDSSLWQRTSVVVG